MANSEINLAERSGNLVESHKGYDPRIIFFYFVLAALLLTLMAGLAYQQLSKTSEHASAERQQNQRRVIFPGPRGDIFDRHGRLLVGNNHRFAVLLHLDELKAELLKEFRRIRKNYAEMGDKDIPDSGQLRKISRVTLVQRYLDQINTITGREEKVNVKNLESHFTRRLLLPYELIDNLNAEEFARLIERLPVRSPLEVYASNTRAYPFGSAAAHTLGYVRPELDLDVEDFPDEDLTTFKMPGTVGKDGLEKMFDSKLQGEPGGRVYLVDPSGYRINKPLKERKPKQGQRLVTSLDIDLQLAAEEAIGDQMGAAVAIDVNTGEVLVLASKPDFDLNKFSPRATKEIVAEMNERKAWTNLALNGFFPPGSTFKIVTSIAGLRYGTLKPDQPIVDCDRWFMVGARRFPCYNGKEAHHNVLLRDAIAHSCDIYYYRAGMLLTPEHLATEARRFHLDQRTGIELPGEQGRMIVPDPAWLQRERKERWYDGDTANTSIGQGNLLVTPLQMACFVASVARDDLYTTPTLLHQPNRPTQRHESIGLTPEQRAAVVDGMVGCTERGTAKTLTQVAALRVNGVSIGGKTGTAQIPGKKNAAWFICFAPREKPEIAIAVTIIGETSGEEYSGGRYAAPVASAILKKYFEKKNAPAKPARAFFKTE
jgi:penicillin-binding protein 2